MRVNIHLRFVCVDDARSSVYIIDDDCSTLSHETTNSNESLYLNSKRAKRYNSIYNDDDDVIGLEPSRRRMSSKI